MKFFSYRATGYTGKMVTGSIAAETVESAVRDLSDKGLYILGINEKTGSLARLKRYFLEWQIKRSDILDFTANFAIMLKAGAPILTCLEDIISSTGNAAFKQILKDIQQRLESGSSVTSALEAQGKLFPEIVKTLVAIGEETGRLQESLQEATAYLKRMQDLASAIRKALMYPIFAFFATLGALAFWMLFVIPALSATLKNMGVKLPLLTRVLISTSAFFQANWLIIPVVLIGVPILVSAISKNSQVRYVRDRLILKMPLLQIIIDNKLYASFAEQFRMLTTAGIPMKRLFDLLASTSGNSYFGHHLLEAKHQILSGMPISESLEQQNILPPIVISKIRIGETSGTLDKQLDFLAKYYAKKLDDATENLGKIIEPLVMAVIGGMFALIIMGLLLPIYDLVSKVGKA